MGRGFLKRLLTKGWAVFPMVRRFDRAISSRSVRNRLDEELIAANQLLQDQVLDSISDIRKLELKLLESRLMLKEEQERSQYYLGRLSYQREIRQAMLNILEDANLAKKRS